MASLKVIMDQVRRENLNVSVDSVFVSGSEALQRAQPVCAELQIRLLNQVVNHLRRDFTPLTRNSKSNSGDERMKSPNEFCPSRFIA
jgi:hypothetical protein